jgi:bifunctional non-homologous end joining protein LigD
MSPNKTRTHKNKTDLKKTTPLKKIPQKKSTSRTKANTATDINIDLRIDNRDFAGIVELASRKFSKAKKTKMPRDIKPMLTSLVDEPFTDEQWQFELKLDGYRSLAYVENGIAELRSRNNNNFNKKFDDVHAALSNWKINALIDGEITVLNEEGLPDFSGIQLWDKHRKGKLVFYVFDLLWVEGWNIMDEPLAVRRELLKQIVPDDGVIRFSDHIDDIGVDFFNLTKQNNLEGIVAKKKDSVYIPGTRSKTWLKIKVEQRHEAVICGYTRKSDTDRLFSSLILGIYREGSLKFIGQTGTGFSQALQEELLKKMKPLHTKKNPFQEEPKIIDPAFWLKPFLVCEVKYTELTSEGVMRHASFQGLREDKAAFELNTEFPELPEAEVPVEAVEEDIFLDKKHEQLITTIDGHEMKFTNLTKLYWPEDKITKGDMLNYYYSMAEYIMPYMKDRPQSLNRFPGGIHGNSFYHKNMAARLTNGLKHLKDSVNHQVNQKIF